MSIQIVRQVLLSHHFASLITQGTSTFCVLPLTEHARICFLNLSRLVGARVFLFFFFGTMFRTLVACFPLKNKKKKKRKLIINMLYPGDRTTCGISQPIPSHPLQWSSDTIVHRNLAKWCHGVVTVALLVRGDGCSSHIRNSPNIPSRPP
ncbi:hypothetical protein GGR50DRAFT_8839 [Xylaria sp. CBS 124048]|nr:hypothetical protein GGR50DRAFT_8839 [Xylaria sp. CBS 124048]